MRITKYEHSCLVLTQGSSQLVIDPGMWTDSLPPLRNVVAVVVTHEHLDHWTYERLSAIWRANPDARILSTAGVARAVEKQSRTEGSPLTVEVVTAGDTVTVGEFTLEFFGGRHAVIHSSIDAVDNVGVLVNNILYAPGDALVGPGRPVRVLAAPASAPWLKLGEAMDFVLQVGADWVVPIHEQVLSERGLPIHLSRIEWAAEQVGEYRHLAPGESIDIN